MLVKDEASLLFQPMTKMRIMERIVWSNVAVWSGHVGKYCAVRQPDDRALFTHTLMKPHGSTQGLCRIGEISRHDMRVNRRGDPIEVYGCDLSDAELLLVRDR